MSDFLEKMIADCTSAQFAVPQETIKGNATNDFKNAKNAVYVIEEIGGNPEKTFECFQKFKAQKTRNSSKANSPNKILYVGSSVGSLSERLRQHIDDHNNVSTSSLNLAQWFTGKFQITAKVYDVSPAILQLIEDALHHKLKPAFGKKGGNGK